MLELKNVVKDLTSRIDQLSTSPSNQTVTDVPSHQPHVEHLNKIQDLTKEISSIKAKLSDSESAQLFNQSSRSLQQNVTATPFQSLPRATVSERNFNIVIYGIDECPKSTPKSTRSKNELDKFLPALSKVDPSIQSTSIKDFHRLGKYKEDHRCPRLILVKFL